MEIGVMELDELEWEKMSLGGFTITKLVTTMKERWPKKASEDEKYWKILRKVETKDTNVDERFGIDKKGSLVWKERLYAPK